jgi:glycosyltransferase involved in cell wall biosynthesis
MEDVLRVSLTKPPEAHSAYREMVEHPPERVTYRWNADTPLHAANARHTRLATHGLRWLRLPHVRPWRAGEDCDVVHSLQALLFTRAPWVVDIEHATPFVGTSFDRARLPLTKGIVRRLLSRDNCGAILPWCETAAQGFLKGLGHTESIAARTRVIWPAVPLPPVATQRDGRPVRRLLFVARPPAYNFALKGGRELLAAFLQLKPRYPDLTLTIVSAGKTDSAPDSSAPGVEWYDSVDREKLMTLYRDADVYVMPTFSDTFGMVFLEAMSHGLPVVALNRAYTRDIVSDGVTGLLAPPASTSLSWCTSDGLFTMSSETFIERIVSTPPDRAVVGGLVSRLAALIDDPSLARRLGEAARQEVAAGRFSLTRRNAALREVYDAAADRARRSSGRDSRMQERRPD